MALTYLLCGSTELRGRGERIAAVSSSTVLPQPGRLPPPCPGRGAAGGQSWARLAPGPPPCSLAGDALGAGSHSP